MPDFSTEKERNDVGAFATCSSALDFWKIHDIIPAKANKCICIASLSTT
jgi:hypothetical protein